MSFRSDISRETISAFLREKIGSFQIQSSVYRYGTVESVQDTVIIIRGLAGCHYGEILQFENDAYGLALDLAEDTIGAVLINTEDRKSVV